MLVELSMVEQRYDAVREVLDGATVTDTATRYGVDRRTSAGNIHAAMMPLLHVVGPGLSNSDEHEHRESI